MYNLNNPADLFADLDIVPDPFSYFDRASGDPANPAEILVRTNLFVPSLAGEWYLAVDNLGSTDLSFTILASVTATNLSTNGIVITPRIDITNNMLCLSWNAVVGRSYLVEAKTNPPLPFDVSNTNGNHAG